MSNLSALFIDLDGTIYPNNNGLWDAIARRMNIYMQEVLDLPIDEIPGLRESYYRQYGTTLRGLQTHHQVNSEEFLAFVHDIPMLDFLAPDARLTEMLAELSYPKWILTNSDRAHSQRVLAALGVQQFFRGIIDITAMNFHNKPEPEAFEVALKMAGDPPPKRCVFVDDIPRNLVPAKALGMYTILVGADHGTPEIDVQIPDIYALPAAVAQIEKLAGTYV